MPMLKDSASKELFTRYTSFQVVENTLGKVVEALLKNNRLKRLLYYSDPHALSLPALNNTQSLSLINDHLRTVPRLPVKAEGKSYVIVTLDNFTPNEKQTKFRSCVLGFDIICPYDDWNLTDFKLRPYSIAGEIDSMINKTTIGSLGIADFMGAKMLLLGSELGGISLYYNVETFTDDVKLNDPVNV